MRCLGILNQGNLVVMEGKPYVAESLSVTFIERSLLLVIGGVSGILDTNHDIPQFLLLEEPFHLQLPDMEVFAVELVDSLRLDEGVVKAHNLLQSIGKRRKKGGRGTVNV